MREQYEITATGKDVNELKGLMRDASDVTNERNEVKNNEVGFIELESSNGSRDTVPQHLASKMERKGYAPTSKSFIVPDLPWLNDKKE